MNIHKKMVFNILVMAALSLGSVCLFGAAWQPGKENIQAPDTPNELRINNTCYTCKIPKCGHETSDVKEFDKHCLQHRRRKPYQCGFGGCSHAAAYATNIARH